MYDCKGRFNNNSTDRVTKYDRTGVLVKSCIDRAPGLGTPVLAMARPGIPAMPHACVVLDVDHDIVISRSHACMINRSIDDQ